MKVVNREMELLCNKCGYKKQLGTSVDAKDVLICTECQSTDVTLVDTGGINIKIDGVNRSTISNLIRDIGVDENTIVNICKGLAENISIYDVFNFLAKQGQIKEEGKDGDE